MISSNYLTEQPGDRHVERIGHLLQLFLLVRPELSLSRDPVQETTFTRFFHGSPLELKRAMLDE